MNIYVPARTSFRVLRFVASGLGIWPAAAKRRGALRNFDYFYLFCLLNYAIAFVPTLRGLYVNRDNFIALTNSWLETSGFVEGISIMIFIKYQKPRLQNLLAVTEQQLSREKLDIVKHYANFYAMGFLIIITCYTIVILMYFIIDTPQQTSSKLIMTAVYPFDIGSYTVKSFLYFNQVFVLTHLLIIPNLDGIAILLIFTCTEKLKILEVEFKSAKSLREVVDCIQKHNYVLDVIKETNYIVRFIVFKTVLSFMSSVFGSGLQILHNATPSQCFHQISIMTLVYARMYLCAESAQNMTSAGEDIECAIYSSDWYDEELKLVSMKGLIILRCQRLSVISINGVMRAFDRKYLGMILYTTMSFLITLKTVVDRKY